VSDRRAHAEQGACVVARNYPMKKFGIKVGMPVWEAKKLCPDGAYVKRDFKWYESLSRKMLAEIGTESPRVVYFSVDEFFMEGTLYLDPFPCVEGAVAFSINSPSPEVILKPFDFPKIPTIGVPSPAIFFATSLLFEPIGTPTHSLS